jgi:hypothetical protein
MQVIGNIFDCPCPGQLEHHTSHPAGMAMPAIYKMEGFLTYHLAVLTFKTLDFHFYQNRLAACRNTPDLTTYSA